jgi:hypothetical protein
MNPLDVFEYKLAWRNSATSVAVHSDLHIDTKDWCRRHCERWEWSMTAHTAPYEHTFLFEHAHHARAFKQEFERWCTSQL